MAPYSDYFDYLGVRFAFPIMLVLVILLLIWRPNGLFGKKAVVRL